MTTATTTTYLFANWKMYLTCQESLELAQQLAGVWHQLPPTITMAVFPMALSTTGVVTALAGTSIGVGAQNVYWLDSGGYTGEISAIMYQAVGCRYALIGHSERRHLFHETNHEVRQKLEGALAAQLTPVICIGETLQERQDTETKEVLEAQLRAAFTDVSWPHNKELFIAYEPVWAVGTGEACDANEAERIAAFIEQCVAGIFNHAVPLRILYGGSVRAENINQFLEQPHLNGVLVGAASAKFESWFELVKQFMAFTV